MQATGVGNLGYQWLFDGSPLPDATNAALSLIGIRSNQGGNYAVQISDRNGGLLSAEATVTVLAPPVIVDDPKPLTVAEFSNVMFSVGVQGQEPFGYQWQWNATSLVNATNATLAFDSVRLNQAGQYRVLVSNAFGSVTSAVAQLTVRESLVIFTQPQGGFFTPGNSLSLLVVATSGSPIQYQWRFNDSDIPGATSASLTLATPHEGNSGQYSVSLFDGFTRLNSAVALVEVFTGLAFLQEPLPLLLPLQSQAVWSAEVVGSRAPYSFTWIKLGNPAPILSSNVTSLGQGFFELPALGFADAGSYQLVVRSTARPTLPLVSLPFTLSIAPDGDSDGLPDAFERAHLLNPGDSSDASSDRDLDGASNLEEYQSGTNPADSADAFWILTDEATDPMGFGFIARSNLTYTVEYTDSPGAESWSKWMDVVAHSTNRFLTVLEPAESPHRFYRARTPRIP